MTDFDYVLKDYGIVMESVPYTQQEPVKKLVERLLELQTEVQNNELQNVPMYCPTCTLCGEEECCSPDACVAVKCLSYKEARAENSILWDFLESCKGVGGWTSQAAKDTEQKIHDMWSQK